MEEDNLNLRKDALMAKGTSKRLEKIVYGKGGNTISTQVNKEAIRSCCDLKSARRERS